MALPYSLASKEDFSPLAVQLFDPYPFFFEIYSEFLIISILIECDKSYRCILVTGYYVVHEKDGLHHLIFKSAWPQDSHFVFHIFL